MTRRAGQPSDSAEAIRAALLAQADPAYAKVVARFFKTGPGEYAEGDVFLGLSNPKLRAIGKAHRAARLSAVRTLLSAREHEVRLAALLILVYQFERADPAGRQACVEFYLANLDRVNNWDLVDLSAPPILGAWLCDRDRAVLFQLAGSPDLWRRRVAMVSCLTLVRAGITDDPLRIAEQLLDDPHDLIHKAVGWVLRDVGQRIDRATLDGFLRRHAARMPSTMMRYAVEHHGPAERKAWLARAKRRGRT